MNAQEIVTIALENAEDLAIAIAFLYDGSAMAEMGITDEHQEAVEEASEFLDSMQAYGDDGRNVLYVSAEKAVNYDRENRCFNGRISGWGYGEEAAILDYE